ncbi:MULTISPECIES: hypothetical protein [Paraburkholderia]|uniref:hypothetical protein n=1 Tax=Paraburkholderia TaxID=1822464 RepID=UPI0012EAA6A9|nr:hypothetical protein [Paraburkholderia tropica]MBB2984147.1 hypothetical protein [Paraburkholderia tropica]
MADQVTDTQRVAIVNALREAMLVLRDDKPLDVNNPAFGKIHQSTKSVFSDFGEVYSFHNNEMPEASIKLRTVDDPLDYTDDRSMLKIVPSEFRLTFYVAVRGISISVLKQELDLADYWVSSDGSRSKDNDMGPPLAETPGQHRYRFRANAHSDSRFPVDVELTYFEPGSDAPVGTQPSLWLVRIARAYPLLTPEMRKQKREEERLKKRNDYGYMNLCTGGVCPESGYWEGWTKESGPTDILRIEKGQKFDVVRTVPLTTDRSSCPMVPGQWMWLCSLEEARGFQWKGFTFNG